MNSPRNSHFLDESPFSLKFVFPDSPKSNFLGFSVVWNNLMTNKLQTMIYMLQPIINHFVALLSICKL